MFTDLLLAIVPFIIAAFLGAIALKMNSNRYGYVQLLFLVLTFACLWFGATQLMLLTEVPEVRLNYTFEDSFYWNCTENVSNWTEEPGDDGRYYNNTDFLVTDTSALDQQDPASAINHTGEYVLCYHQINDTSIPYQTDVYARMYWRNGTERTAEIQVSNNGLGQNMKCAAAFASNSQDDIWIVWQSWNDTGMRTDVWAQHMHHDGTLTGANFMITNATHNGDGSLPDVYTDYAGNWTVTWQMYGSTVNNTNLIYAESYDRTDVVRVAEWLVSPDLNYHFTFPSIAGDFAGDYAITYVADGRVANHDIYAICYNENGTVRAPEWLVNTNTVSYQTNPDVGMHNVGNFTIVWQSNHGGTGDWEIYMQGYNTTCNATGVETQVSDEDTEEDMNPATEADCDDTFIVVWQSQRDSSYWDTLVRFYYTNGTNITNEITANENLTSSSQNPCTAMDCYNATTGWYGDAVVVWQDIHTDPAIRSDVRAKQYWWQFDMVWVDYWYLINGTCDNITVHYNYGNYSQNYGAFTEGYNVWTNILMWILVLSVIAVMGVLLNNSLKLFTEHKQKRDNGKFF